MKENIKEKINNDNKIKRMIRQKTINENNFDTYKNLRNNDKKEIVSYVMKKYKDKTKVKNNTIHSYNITKICDISTKLNTGKITNNSDFIKSKIEESSRLFESYDDFPKLNRVNSKEGINHASSYDKQLKKNNINNINNFTLIDGSIDNNKKYGTKRYLLSKFKLIESLENGVHKAKKSTLEKRNRASKYFSLKQIQRYHDLVRSKTIRKKLFRNSINKIEDLNKKNQTQKDFMKDVNGMYLLKKKNCFSQDAKYYKNTVYNKNIIIKKNNSHLNIYGIVQNFKKRINEDNNKMKNEIKDEYSKLESIKNEYISKRPNENTQKGLEKLFYLYNKQRAKDQKIVTNRTINNKYSKNLANELIDLNPNKKKNRIVNERNIINIAQNKVNKLFHDLLIFQLPKLSNTKYNRKILYDIFIEFKILLLLSMMRNKDVDIYKKGIDFNTFYNCNTKINQQGKIIAKKLYKVFNNKIDNQYLNLENYIDGMLKLKDTNKENKLNLFFEMLDNKSDGSLEYNDIYKLSIICLQKIIFNIEDEKDIEKLEKDNNSSYSEIIQGLAEFFCKLIFKLVNVDIKEKIPMKLLKKMIIQGGEQADYIELLFGSSNFT